MNEKQIGALSLARRAGKAFAGEGKCEDKIRKNEAVLCVLVWDAAFNTVKKFTGLTEKNNVLLVRASTKSELGRLFGRDEISVAVLTDDNFSLLFRSKER